MTEQVAVIIYTLTASMTILCFMLCGAVYRLKSEIETINARLKYSEDAVADLSVNMVLEKCYRERN